MESPVVRAPRTWGERERKPRRRKRVGLAFGGMMVASFALAMTASNIAHRERAHRPLVATGAIVWGGRIFSAEAELAGWLRSRGADYSTWAARHRAAAHAQRNPLAFGAPPGTGRTDAIWPYLGLFGALALMLIVFMRLTPADVSAQGILARSASLTWYVLAICASAAAGLIVAELLR